MSAVSDRRIAVIGLGYVGLPVAVAMARHFAHTIAFDIDTAKIDRLTRHQDNTQQVSREDLQHSSLHFSADPTRLRSCNFFIIAVPTPIDKQKHPDLSSLRAASQLVATQLTPGDIVVYESTVYPGVTEDICAPLLELGSGLRCGVDFKLGYSPERINPGDKEHRFETITKVVSGQDEPSLDAIAAVYETVVEAGVHRASSIRVAEASKIIENVQRDLNIALMNELAMIFDKLNLSTKDVLAASASKWNFLNFYPGLVGGHCIGVDPYYLTSKAEEVGIIPQVILAGRRINSEMGVFIAQRTIKELALAGKNIAQARILVLGISFKENLSDIRNSRVPDLIEELRSYGSNVFVHDPLVDPQAAKSEYDLDLLDRHALNELTTHAAFDVVVLAVPHAGLQALAIEFALTASVLTDVRACIDPQVLPPSLRYWQL